MPSNFVDIKITGLDDASSGSTGQGALVAVVLRLSENAPSAWAEYFNQAWQQHLYMMKRRASVFSNRLEIICVPSELETDHIPELKKIIAETNQAFRRYVAEQTRISDADEERACRQRQELSDLKGKLKFD